MSPRSFDVYKREAQKLYALADALPFGQIRNEFIDIARQYEHLARHAETVEQRTTTQLPDERESLPVGRRSLVPER